MDGPPFAVTRASGRAGDLHGLAVPEPAERAVWVLDVTHDALVLGSTQRDDVVDAAEAAARGVEVARRRSGGGAVHLVPGEAVWIDVILPRGDPRWDDDVSTSARWLGEVWVAALADLVDEPLRVHDGPMVADATGRLVCFAGLGPGEVVVDVPDGGRAAKVVGISQRRTRAAARFQCVVLRSWRPDVYEALLPSVGTGSLTEIAVRPVTAPAPAIVQAFLSRLPG